MAGAAEKKAKLSGPITFVTGNAKKLAEVQRIVGDDLPLVSQGLDLPELQGEPEEVASVKAKEAFSRIGTPVLVEDTSLCFNAMQGLPGVYIKWFLDKLGHDGLNQMLVGFEDKTAYAQCIFAYCDESGETKVFVGQTHGKIVPARGDNKFGWDPIFEPDESNGLTYAEMTMDAKNAISHRGRSLQKVREFFGAA
jgi:inosine triphosphate pyrophosphatase